MHDTYSCVYTVVCVVCWMRYALVAVYGMLSMVFCVLCVVRCVLYASCLRMCVMFDACCVVCCLCATVCVVCHVVCPASYTLLCMQFLVCCVWFVRVLCVVYDTRDMCCAALRVCRMSGAYCHICRAVVVVRYGVSHMLCYLRYMPCAVRYAFMLNYVSCTMCHM